MQISRLNRISEHVYWLAPDGTTDRPTLGVIVGDEATLIDEIVSYNADYYIWGHHLEPMPANEMAAFTGLLRSISAEVTQAGDNRLLIVQRSQEKIGMPLDDETIEIIDAFLAGLQRAE